MESLADLNKKVSKTFAGKVSDLVEAFIKDKNYVQLSRPFPFLIKQNEMLVTTRSYNKIVSILNGKLFSFYSK